MPRPAVDGIAGRPWFGGVDVPPYEVADFARDVVERSLQGPVLVHYWVPWHAPCRGLRKVLEELTAARPGLTLASVNVEMQDVLAENLGLQGVPLLQLYLNGTPASTLEGVLPKATIASWLDELTGAAPPARRRGAAVAGAAKPG